MQDITVACGLLKTCSAGKICRVHEEQPNRQPGSGDRSNRLLYPLNLDLLESETQMRRDLPCLKRALAFVPFVDIQSLTRHLSYVSAITITISISIAITITMRPPIHSAAPSGESTPLLGSRHASMTGVSESSLGGIALGPGISSRALSEVSDASASQHVIYSYKFVRQEVDLDWCIV